MLHALIDGRLLFPGMAKSDRTNLKMTSIGALAVIGPYHADINGRTARGGIRGPFDKLPVQSGSVPTYPVLWEHNADLERTMLFEAEAECIPRLSCNDAEQSLIDSKVESLWATASQSHFNVNFQFNSQSTAMQFTPRRTIGGRAWLSMKLKSVDHEKALVLWGNTSLGLLIHWWHSNRQQIGRGNIGKNMLVSMPVLDIDALSPSILKRASAIFDTFSADPMLPINELHQDSVRKQIDEAVMTEVLGLPLALHRPDGPMDLLRRKLASEPSIIGGKRSA